MEFPFEEELAEWEDELPAMKLEAVINWMVGLLALILLAYNLNSPTTALPALLICIFCILRGVLALVEYRDEKHPLLSIAGFGSINRALLGGIAGAVITLILFSSAPMAIASFAITGISWLPFSGAFLFVVILSPLAEEFFFRGLIFFTFARLIGSSIISAVITSALFAIFHFVAYGADTNAMMAAFFMSLIWIAMNAAAKSFAPSISSHLIYNYLALARISGV